MRGLSFGLVLGVGVACGLIGCSGEKAPPGSGVPPRPENNAGATSVGNGGQGSTPGGPTAGSGPDLVVPTGGSADAGTDAPVEAGVCDDLNIQTYEAVPTVLLLVDTSGSMFEKRAELWDPLYKALTDANGVVSSLQAKVRFGFTSYTSPESAAATCPTLINTDLKINNFDTIKAEYTKAGVAPDIKGNTPTGPAVVAAAAKLAAFTPEPPGPKFILLVTDGDPDTCGTPNPNCGQDESIKAIQDAYTAGIGTFVIGIGDVLTSTNQSMRVGLQHLQDIANAGAGQPVAPNSNEYKYQPCIKNQLLTATYAATVAEGGTAPYYTVSSKDSTAQKLIADAILASLAQARSCSFNMDAQVKGDASLGTLTFNGNALQFGDDNGWSLGADLTSVTLAGTACETWKKEGGKVNVNFPCKLVPVEPVDVPPLK